jgi:hypothetical protein
MRKSEEVTSVTGNLPTTFVTGGTEAPEFKGVAMPPEAPKAPVVHPIELFVVETSKAELDGVVKRLYAADALWIWTGLVPEYVGEKKQGLRPVVLYQARARVI